MHPQSPGLTIGRTVLKESDDLDIIGVTFDPNMIFETHLYFYFFIKKGQQCKAGRERYTPYQSEDPSPTITTYRQKEEKGKESRRL